MTSIEFPYRIAIGLLFVVGIIILQIFLSRNENKWLGRILPMITFLFSCIVPLNMTSGFGQNESSLLIQILVTWLLANIPTIILLLIYFACRADQKKNGQKQMDKMNIQDL